MNRTIILHGILGERFGHTHTFKKLSYRRAWLHLLKTKEGFAKAVQRGQFRMFVGNYCSKMITHGSELIGSVTDNVLHIIPVIRARKSGKGFFGIILGVALMAFAWWNPLGWGAAAGYLGTLGAGIALNSAAMLFTPAAIQPDYSDREGDNKRPSYMFKNSMRTFEQGQPMRLVFGEWKAASGSVVSASIYTEDI
jgi:predicted phage tail protein